MVAFLLCFIATSCSKNESSSQQEMTENFKALVMGGKSIDPNHTWSTAVLTPVTVSVNLNEGGAYTVYLFLSNPATDANATYMGIANLKTGESATIYATKPAKTEQLFAACYDADGNGICLPVTGSEINFNGKISEKPTSPTTTTGNNWSVPVLSMPDVSDFTTGDLIEVKDVDPDLAEDARARLKISSDFNGFIPFLRNHTNLSVYVTGTWTLTFDQYFANGNVLVVGNGGKIIVPKGFKLANGYDDSSIRAGSIIVMPGGEITGEGTIESTSVSANSFYNAGTITTNEIRLTGGLFYNAGTIGLGEQTSTILSGESSTTGNPSQFINGSTASFLQTKGSALAILNGNNIKVLSNLTLSGASRMDDGSTIECGSITLQGDASLNSILYMGNSAYLNCSGSASITNYGVWGPSGNNYQTSALFQLNGCSRCTTTSGNASTFMLDHVQLLLPQTFDGFSRISKWINGSTDGIDASRQTCFFLMEKAITPNSNCMLYAFEFPGNNSVRDFDYNDLILRVSTPQSNDDGTFTSNVDIMAIGSDMSIYVLYNDKEFGSEVHEAMGVTKTTTVNTSSYTKGARRLGELTFTDPNTDLGQLPFSLRITDKYGANSQTYVRQKISESPLFLAISGNEEGKWYWPKEGSNIGLAYLLFSTWANNQQSAIDWYDSSNTSSSHIISW